MDSAFATHLVLEQGVDHAVSRRLRLRFEGVRSNCDTMRKHMGVRTKRFIAQNSEKGTKQDRLEMRFFGCAPLHRRVVRMEMRVVANNQGGRREGGCQLSQSL